ncbi:MAG: DUF58 domain-containing protein [Chloroflexi bacterium]|nr:DUF58 domain-containing protein [Chloroflexota bacterium]
MRKLFGFVRFLWRNQNLIVVVGLAAALFVLAYASGFWIFYRAAYLLTALVPLSLFWARANLRGLSVEIDRLADRLQVGQQLEVRFRVRNLSMLPKLWLEVEDPSDMPGRAARTVISLVGRGYRAWKVSVPCTRRGLYTVGPLTITSGDPFGLFRFRRRYGEAQAVMVYPLPSELPYFQAPPAQLAAETAPRTRTHYVTPNAAAVRDYQPGDGLNRIHWRSTARLRRLMVKTFELDPSGDIWLALDLHCDVQAGAGDDSTEEYGARIACSLGHHFLSANRMVGYLACGRRMDLLAPARGMQRYIQLFESLALARAEGEVPLARLLEEEARRFGRHTTLIVITSSPDEEWVTVAQSLVQQGTRVAVVLLEAASFGGKESVLLPYSTLVAADILTYLVRRDDDLSLALGPQGAAGEAYRAQAAPLRR